MLYLVSYDLKGGASADYQELYAAFNGFDDCRKCLESSWLVKSDKTCREVRDILRAKMKPEDLIVVVPYGEVRSAWIEGEVVDWVHKYQP